MGDKITRPKDLARIIKRLPSDAPRIRHGIWYRTQKEHWLGWLSEYDGPGAYGRIVRAGRDARFVYNHIVCPDMLLWLAEAAGVNPQVVEAARNEAIQKVSLQSKSAAIRRHVPWSEIAQALGTDSTPSHAPARRKTRP
jgi:hypothetical protein